MKVYLVRHGQVPHNATKQYNVGDEDHTAEIIVANKYNIIIDNRIEERRGLKNCEIKEYEL